VGLSAITVVPAAASPDLAPHQSNVEKSFAERLLMVRSAATKIAEESEMLVAQATLPGGVFRPPPVKSFDNWGKAPFQDTWKNFANVPRQDFRNVPQK
jgi:hypothetical protein